MKPERDLTQQEKLACLVLVFAASFVMVLAILSMPLHR